METGCKIGETFETNKRMRIKTVFMNVDTHKEEGRTHREPPLLSKRVIKQLY